MVEILPSSASIGSTPSSFSSSYRTGEVWDRDGGIKETN